VFLQTVCALVLQCGRLHPAVAVTLLDVHPHLRLLSGGPRHAAVPLPVDSHDGEVRCVCMCWTFDVADVVYDTPMIRLFQGAACKRTCFRGTAESRAPTLEFALSLRSWFRLKSLNLSRVNDPGTPRRYTISGSPDGVIRLWASGEPFQRARAQPTASCPTASSASSEDALDSDLAALVQGAPSRLLCNTKAMYCLGSSGGTLSTARLDDELQRTAGAVLHSPAAWQANSPLNNSRSAGGGKRRKLEAGSEDGLAARINRELERSLRDFVALATVSRDPGYREDCFRGAKFLGTLLESLGALLHRLCLALSPPAALI
jgi:hypothetical protein